MVDLIEAKYGEQGNPVFRHQLFVGFQIAIAMIMHSLLNQPPVLNLQSLDYNYWLKEMVRHAISVRGAPTVGVMDQVEGRPASRLRHTARI